MCITTAAHYNAATPILATQVLFEIRMKILFSESLSYRFAYQAMLVSIVISFLVTALLIGADYQLSQQRIFEDTRALLQSGSQTSRLAVYNLDPEMTQTIVNGLVDYPAIVYAVIVDNNGKILARNRRSPQLSRYRWISDGLIGNNISLQQELTAPNTDTFLGYLLIEIDSFILGKRFLQRASLLFVGGMMLAGLITLLLILLHRRHLTQPLQSMIARLDEIDPKAPEDERLAYPLRHDIDEIGILVEQINKLLLSVASHTARRERAESDLRKNLSSVEFIVTERTEALRSTSQRLQTQLHTYQQDIKQYQHTQKIMQEQQQQNQTQLLLRLQLMQGPLKQLTCLHSPLLQQSFSDQLKQNCQHIQQHLLPTAQTSTIWVSDALELMTRNLSMYLRVQKIQLHCSFENPLAAVWQVQPHDLIWLSEYITLRLAEQTQQQTPLTNTMESLLPHELHLRGRLNIKHQPETPHLQITWHLHQNPSSLQPLMKALLVDPDAGSQQLRETLKRMGATLRLSTKHTDRLRLLIPLQAQSGPHLNDWSANNLPVGKFFLVWCEQQDALRHLQNTLRGLHIAFDTLLIEADAQLGDNIESLTRAGYLGCLTNHAALAQRLRQQSQLRFAELKPLDQTFNNTHLSYPLRQQECLQLLISWSQTMLSAQAHTWLVIETHPIHQAMIRSQLTLCGQTCHFANDATDAFDLLQTQTITQLLINPTCLPQADEWLDQLYQSPNASTIALHWLGQAPEGANEKCLSLPFTTAQLAHLLLSLS